MLANYKNLWCLTGRSEKWPDWYGMRFPPCYAGQESLSLDETGRQCYLKQQGSRGITFYPVVRYKGMRVHPIAWHPEATEPRLKVHSAWCSSDYPPGDELAFDEMLKAEGWTWDQREGGEGYVHVDDLEKIEGPPPEGGF